MVSLVSVNWDVQRYADYITPNQSGRGQRAEAKLSLRFPVNSGDDRALWEKPGVIVDRHGHILVWHLPDALTRRRQV